MSAAKVKTVAKFTLIGLVTLGNIIGIIVCFVVMGTKTLSPIETQLWGFILAALGIFASWLVTHVYAQLSTQSATEEAKKAHNENVRTFALKAAEKVLTLSGEIDRVAERLKLALEDTEEEEKLAVAALTLRERIGAAIQSLETIKAVNNNALSDWRSIIGEDIKLQNQLQEQLTQLVGKIESMVPSEELDDVREQMDEIRNEIKEKVAALPFGLPPAPSKKKKNQQIEVPCPSCATKRVTHIRIKAGAQKTFRCRGCNKFLKVAYVSESSPPTTEIIPDKTERVECSVCREMNDVALPSMQGASTDIHCTKCDSHLSIARAKDGPSCRTINPSTPPARLLDMIFAKIPPRPWEHGMHKSVTEALSVSNGTVERAIAILIKTGRLPATDPVESTDPPKLAVTDPAA